MLPSVFGIVWYQMPNGLCVDVDTGPWHVVDEIPTCVVDRLNNEMGFVVLSRPNAFKQFFEAAPYMTHSPPDFSRASP
jgi:hypothetical protein